MTYGFPRWQSWVAWLGGMVLSAITAASVASFWLGGEIRTVANIEKRVDAHDISIAKLGESVSRGETMGARQYATKTDLDNAVRDIRADLKTINQHLLANVRP